MTHPPIDQLLPHGPPIRFVEEIVGEVDGAFVCRARIPAELGVEGLASPLLGIEMGAQTAAVLAALDRGSDDIGPRMGYLVSVRNARFETGVLPVDRALTVRARRAGGVHPLATFEVEIDGYLSATIGTYAAD